MEKEIIEFVLNTFGLIIIWHFIIKNKDFTIYSKEGFYTFLAIILAAVLIKLDL
jgi:hypothetical protein